MSRPVSNLNLRRRPFPGLLAMAAAIPLRPLLFPFRRKAAPDAPLWVFSAYMVGDLFMALPSLKRLAAALPVRVLCRPDCVAILRREGLDPVPFDNAIIARRTPSALLRTWRSAMRLRSLPANIALDLDADPRTALWLRLAGVPRVVSFRRPFGVLFDATFDLPADAIHQADKDMAVAEKYLRRRWDGGRGTGEESKTSFALSHLPSPISPVHEASNAKNSSWLLSVWTRKPEKNWPLDLWEDFMGRMEAKGIPFAVLDAPDGDAGFRDFRERWRGRAEFVSGSLEFVAERVRRSSGVAATDNFLGHMAGYYGKPVLWINACSPAAQVEPRGPRTLRVGHAGDVAPARPARPSADEVWREFLGLLS